MKVLVINCGSSSFKYQILDMTTETLLCSGLVERIGQDLGVLNYKKFENGEEVKKIVKEEPFKDHTVALQAVMALVTDPVNGTIASIDEIKAVGHRVVQGGETYTKACLIDAASRAKILELSPLAPLHNPANIQGIDVAQKICPNAPSVAVFDTEFHSTMEAKAFRYALPNEYYTKHSIRRYGFHGTSHKYVSEKAAEFLGKNKNEINVITCHLGNGSSITAVKGGKCIDTSMGMTPLAGVIMGTRCGDIDPAIAPFICKAEGKTPAEVDSLMNKQSGLLGLCGMSDMRDIHDAREKGNKDAILAFEMFCYRIKQYIGSYWAALGTVDALVFTAGIGENDPFSRAGILDGLESWGVKIDPELNKIRSSEPRCIAVKSAKIPVLVIPTNEELEIARTTIRVVKEAK